MRRNRLNVLVTFIIILGSIVAAYLFYVAARHTTKNDVLQAILENLSADTIVIAFTLTVVDAWTRIRDHRDYKSIEQQTILDVQDRVFLCISVVRLQFSEVINPVANSSIPKLGKHNSSYSYMMYATAKSDIDSGDYSKLTVAMTNDILWQIQKAVDDIDKTIMTYEKSLQGNSFQALRAIHRKLDLIASPGLQLLAQGIGLAGHAKDNVQLKKGAANSLQSKIKELLQVGILSEDLSRLLHD